MVNRQKGLEFDGRTLFPAHFVRDTPHLDNLDVAPVNNHVGVSTLAITSDRYLGVWQQGHLNIQDPGKIVATGSGSADYADLDTTSLRNSVIRGMQRELREEGLRRGVDEQVAFSGQTTIIAFFRWLDRGGKPEFVGLTRLGVSRADVYPDHREVFEVRKKRSARPLAHWFRLPTLDQIPEVLREIRALEPQGARLFLPLKVILYRMEALAKLKPDVLADALYGDARLAHDDA
jgi:hypothetical protein